MPQFERLYFCSTCIEFWERWTLVRCGVVGELLRSHSNALSSLDSNQAFGIFCYCYYFVTVIVTIIGFWWCHCYTCSRQLTISKFDSFSNLGVAWWFDTSNGKLHLPKMTSSVTERGLHSYFHCQLYSTLLLYFIIIKIVTTKRKCQTVPWNLQYSTEKPGGGGQRLFLATENLFAFVNVDWLQHFCMDQKKY